MMSQLPLLAGAVNQETKGRTALAYISTVVCFFFANINTACSLELISRLIS